MRRLVLVAALVSALAVAPALAQRGGIHGGFAGHGGFGGVVSAGMSAAAPHSVGCAKGRVSTIPDSADLHSSARASLTQPLQDIGLAKIIFSTTVGSRGAVSTAMITTATIFAFAPVSVTASVSIAAGDGDGHGGGIRIPRTTKIKNLILSSPTR